MKVTIMYRNTYHGGDGWTYHPVTVEIADTCPRCGGPRGKPEPRRQCEDGQWFDLNAWTNDCGHIDRYRDVYAESLERLSSPLFATPADRVNELVDDYADGEIDLDELFEGLATVEDVA